MQDAAEDSRYPVIKPYHPPIVTYISGIIGYFVTESHLHYPNANINEQYQRIGEGYWRKTERNPRTDYHL